MRQKTLIIWASFLTLIALLVLPTGAALAAYDYSYAITVFNNSTTSYPNGTSVLLTFNQTQLQNYGYINAGATDTDMQEGAIQRDYMPSSSYVGVFIPDFIAGQNRQLDYEMGYSPAQTSFPIITGVNGNVTIPASSSLDLGNNWSIGFNNTYLQDGETLYSLPNSTNITTASGNVTLAVSSAIDSYTTGATSWQPTYGSNYVHAQTFTTSTSYTVGFVSIPLYRVGSPGTITVQIADGTPSGTVLTSGTYDGNTITTSTSGEYISVSITPYALSASHVYAIILRDTGGDSSNYVAWAYQNSNGYAGGAFWEYTSSWSSYAYDFAFKVYSTAPGSLTAPYSEGQHDLIVSENTISGDLELWIDGVLSASTAYTYSVPVSSDNIIALQDVPYAGSMSISVNGTQQAYYAPTSLIAGSYLTDESGNGHTGTINWGSNPTGIEITLGAITSTSSTTSSTGTNETIQNYLAAPPTLPAYPSNSDSALSNMPIYTEVQAMSNALSMSVTNGYIMLIEITALAFGVAGWVGLGGGMGFLAGFGSINILAAGTPINPTFFIITIGGLALLGMFLWRRY